MKCHQCRMLWHHGTLCIYFPDPAFCRSYVPDREQYQPPCLQKGTGGRGIFCVPLRLSSADHRGLYAKHHVFGLLFTEFGIPYRRWSIRWCSMYFHSIRFWCCGWNCDHRSGASCVSHHHNTEILLRIYE